MEKSCSQSDPVSSTLGAGRQLSHCSGRGCPTGPCFRRRPRSLPAGVACDGVPALVLIDVDELHVPLCEDVAGAAGQAWGATEHARTRFVMPLFISIIGFCEFLEEKTHI